ncbi:EAL domain-containing response regulator [cf. Phormidesmis sp. LEGE 11477]|uniref:EAL domain-containing response regulator n=1 Tax=cf. Phormidesmis sp. LEGE 11477 TaxID=1828680 RepID=UPI001880B719|nr:EAL domain-containing response regulator [cf. Phormidesmis sp. LEGE 11477]MBE9064808.1 EAL domain-containing protein [cf. Phormidesmis sp. LEGE 11477]
MNGQLGCILIVDDAPTNLFVLSKLLTSAGYEVIQSSGGLEAIALAQSHQPTLILLDIMMPNMDGYEVCRRLRSMPETAHIPVIFLSALDAPFDKIQAFHSGAADYVTKPFQTEEVMARVHLQIELRLARKRQEQINVELEKRVDERTQLLELAHSQMVDLAQSDRLTRLPNRPSFLRRLGKVMAQSQTDPRVSFAVLFLDCDRFKRINDSLGYRIGDQLLKGIARRLSTFEQKHAEVDMVARFGGDEFGILLLDIADKTDVVDFTEKVSRILSRPFLLAGHHIFSTISIGMVWGDRSYVSAEHLLRDADVAMYQAKARMHRKYCWFEPGMHHLAVKLLNLETGMRLALQRREFELHYQPIIDLERMKIVGFEALVRWQHPVEGLILPNEFIPFAEETGFIVELGAQILEMACTHVADWERAGVVDDELTISVNIAPEQLLQPSILNHVQHCLDSTGICAQRLRLELTERSLIGDHELVDDILQALKQQNIRLSIDDFGTGYSALGYLHQLPVDCLKVDRLFVKSITDDPGSLGIVPLIISMAKTMNMEVVAEGIENITQLDQLRKLGCQYGQGYLFHKAVAADRVADLLSAPISSWLGESD